MDTLFPKVITFCIGLWISSACKTNPNRCVVPSISSGYAYLVKADGTSGRFTSDFENVEPGKVISLICHNGFKVSGHNRFNCAGNGSWNPPVASCVKLECSIRLPIVTNGYFESGRYDVGSRRTMKCNPEYIAGGAKEIICNRNGQWSSPGNCTRRSTTTTTTKTTAAKPPCSESQFTCENGKCISLSEVCNGVENCDDDSDEKDCPVIRPPVITAPCSRSQFTCENGKCISLSEVCNGVENCDDDSDEKDCPATKLCPPSEFTCDNGKCILKPWICDGDNDCGDLSDERNCPRDPEISQSCIPNLQFSCGNGICIPSAYVCDEDNSCPDGSDEQSCSDICKTALMPHDDHGFFLEFDSSYHVQQIKVLFCNDGYKSYDSIVRCEPGGKWSRILGGRCYKEYVGTGYGQETNLHLAAMFGDLEEVKRLVRLGADVFAKSDALNTGKGPIHYAIWPFGHLEVVKYLISVEPALEYDKNIYAGHLPLHFAVLIGDLDIVKYFIDDLETDIEAVDSKFGRTSLHFASLLGQLDVVKWLVNRGADPNATSNDFDLQHKPIGSAAHFGHLPVVKYLIEQVNSDMTYWTNARGFIPLHSAASRGNLSVVSYFIETVGVDIEIGDVMLGRSALHHASQQGHLEVVKWLVSRGANVTAPSNLYDNKMKPIHQAATFGWLSVVKYFVETFPYLKDVKDILGRTPLMVAEIVEKKEVVEYLRNI